MRNTILEQLQAIDEEEMPMAVFNCDENLIRELQMQREGLRQLLKKQI